MSVPVRQAAPGGLLRASAVVGAMTLLSRILGMVRDIALATLLGATASADAFFVAFKIPNFFRRLFAEGAFAQAFVPVLAEYHARGGLAAMRGLADRLAAVLGGGLLVLVALAVGGAPLVTLLIAPGFWGDPLRFELTVSLVRVTAPYVLFVALTGLAGAMLNSMGRFALPAVTPVLLNLTLIAAALLIAPCRQEPALVLAWGVLVAGMLQLLVQLPPLLRLGALPRPVWDRGDPGVRKVFGLMVPALFGVSVSQINLLLDSVFASFLPAGSVSWLYFSDRLVEFPLGVFGVAIATVILPSLSRHSADQRGDAFAATLDWAVRGVLLFGVPATIALVLLAESILATLFMYGRLSPADAVKAAWSLQAYALGLLAFMLIKVLAPGYFARQHGAAPVRMGLVALLANLVLNVLFALPLAVLFDLGHAGLALATSCAAYINASLLWRGLRREGLYRAGPGLLAACVRIGGATAVMAAGLCLWRGSLAEWTSLEWWARAAWLAGLCLGGAGLYALALLLLGARPAQFRQQSA